MSRISRAYSEASKYCISNNFDDAKKELRSIGTLLLTKRDKSFQEQSIRDLEALANEFNSERSIFDEFTRERIKVICSLDEQASKYHEQSISSFDKSSKYRIPNPHLV